MGFLRKYALISTGGLAPIKANSKKERTAKALEKQLRLQQQALKQHEQQQRALKQQAQRLRLTLTIYMDGAAFYDENFGYNPAEPARLLREIADDVEGTFPGGMVLDRKGNRCGKWEIHGGPYASGQS